MDGSGRTGVVGDDAAFILLSGIYLARGIVTTVGIPGIYLSSVCRLVLILIWLGAPDHNRGICRHISSDPVP